ncbi:MAG TPA: hypothetical protein VMU69_16385 [Bradyrhizobium sp.]|nr:hypothetical protein [Bradyrhizobium sp.]
MRSQNGCIADGMRKTAQTARYRMQRAPKRGALICRRSAAALAAAN